MDEDEAEKDMQGFAAKQWQRAVVARQLTLARKLRAAQRGEFSLGEEDLREAEWLDRVDEELPTDPTLLDEEMLQRLGLGSEGVARAADDVPTIGGPLRLQAVGAVGKRPSQLLREAQRRAVVLANRNGTNMPHPGRLADVDANPAAVDASVLGPVNPMLARQAKRSADEADEMGRARRTLERDNALLDRVGP